MQNGKKLYFTIVTPLLRMLYSDWSSGHVTDCTLSCNIT